MSPSRGVDASTLALEVLPMSQHIGAEVLGVDLSRPLDEAEVGAIRDALLRWKVIFFREQDLTRDQFVAFGWQFGTVLPAHPVLPAPFPERPEVLRLEKSPGHDDLDASTLDHRWHSDVSYADVPPMGSILRAVEVPPYGGDTEWTSTATAYSALSPQVRALLDGLHVVHHNVLHLKRGETTPTMRAFQARELRAVHPLVSVHPETGERSLFVNPDYTSHIVELSRRESDHLLAMLYEQLADREFTVRFRWRPGSMAFWDNRATLHRAPADVPPGYHRSMERITLAGTNTRGIDGFVSHVWDAGAAPSTPEDGEGRPAEM